MWRTKNFRLVDPVAYPYATLFYNIITYKMQHFKFSQFQLFQFKYNKNAPIWPGGEGIECKGVNKIHIVNEFYCASCCGTLQASEKKYKQAWPKIYNKPEFFGKADLLFATPPFVLRETRKCVQIMFNCDSKKSHIHQYVTGLVLLGSWIIKHSWSCFQILKKT